MQLYPYIRECLDNFLDLFPAPKYYLSMENVNGQELVGYGLKGNMTGQPPKVPGINGYSMYFNGINQTVDLGKHWGQCFGDLTLCPQGQTIAFWFKYGGTKTTSSSPGEVYFLCGGGQTGSSHGVAFYHKNAQFSTRYSKPNGDFWTTYMTLDNDNWSHVTATWATGQGLRMYVNGRLETQTVTSGYFAPYATINWGVYLGRANNNGTNVLNGEFFMDELLLWETALSDYQVTKLFETYIN